MFGTPWRLTPISANNQLAFACYQQDGARFRLGALSVLSLRNGRIGWIAGFVDPHLYRFVAVPSELPVTN